MQSKLLRVIQERAVRPIGAVAELPVNVRIVSATHKDLAVEVQEGRFRQDLYYRLNVIQVRMPPLRERVDDLGVICAAVLQRIARDAGVSPAPRLAADALEHLSHYGFPGNVRELENLLYRAVTLAGAEVIERDDLGLGDEAFADSEWQGLELLPPDAPPPATAPEPAALPRDLVDYLDAVERDVIGRALVLHRSNRTAAGASLGLSLRQMRYRMARLGINPGDHGSE
jgi:two-component system response regulator PilR (NtrC family)